MIPIRFSQNNVLPVDICVSVGGCTSISISIELLHEFGITKDEESNSHWYN